MRPAVLPRTSRVGEEGGAGGRKHNVRTHVRSWKSTTQSSAPPPLRTMDQLCMHARAGRGVFLGVSTVNVDHTTAHRFSGWFIWSWCAVLLSHLFAVWLATGTPQTELPNPKKPVKPYNQDPRTVDLTVE